MAERMYDNRLLLSGTVETEIQFSHAMRGISYDKFLLSVRRTSGACDVLPVLINRALLPAGVLPGAAVELFGRLRSRPFRSADGTERLMLNAFAGGLTLLGEPTEANEVFLSGVLARPPIYRMTPRQREIADLLLSVPRAFGKEDVISVIAWGRNARAAAQLCVGEHIALTGRLQSRTYNKRLPSGESVERVTYEVSASTLIISESGPHA